MKRYFIYVGQRDFIVMTILYSLNSHDYNLNSHDYCLINSHDYNLNSPLIVMIIVLIVMTMVLIVMTIVFKKISKFCLYTPFRHLGL